MVREPFPLNPAGIKTGAGLVATRRTAGFVSRSFPVGHFPGDLGSIMPLSPGGVRDGAPSVPDGGRRKAESPHSCNGTGADPAAFAGGEGDGSRELRESGDAGFQKRTQTN
jgi:hypothetical protein